MGLSSRLFLLSADNTLHAMANAAFMRMLRQEAVARIPDFAGQRVRQASAVVEVVGGRQSRLVHCTFSVLDIDGDGVLDVERLSTQQFARVDDPVRTCTTGARDQGPDRRCSQSLHCPRRVLGARSDPAASYRTGSAGATVMSAGAGGSLNLPSARAFAISSSSARL